MKFEKGKSSKKSIAITVLVITGLVAIMAAVASIGIIKVSSNSSTATVEPVIFKNDGKIYSFNFGEDIKQIKYEKPKKPVMDTSKFNTLSEFDMGQLILESAVLSGDKTSILIRNKVGVLYLVNLKNNEVDKYTVIDENVTEAFFTGLKNDIVYMKGKDFYYSSGGYKSEIEKNIEKIAVATDGMSVYYTKSDLTLVKFDVGKTTTLDSNVCDMVYCGGEKLAYIKDYSTVTEDGNLFYADGKEVIDVGVKAEAFLE